MPRRCRRIWSETVPVSGLTQPRVTRLLQKYDLEILVAVRPWDLSGVDRLVAHCNDQGVPVGLWPMLGDGEGRWANGENVKAYREFVLRVLDNLPRGEVTEVAVDLEPPFFEVRRLLERKVPHRLRRHPFAETQSAFRELVSSLRERNVQVSAAVLPLVLYDNGAPTWQDYLQVPVDGIGWNHVSCMLYTSLLEGWSQGTLGRRHALDALLRGARRTLGRFGPLAGVSLGAVGVGAFGSEPMYRDPEELRSDVATVLREGIEHLTLLDLGGVLGREPAEAWLSAFTETRPAPPEPISHSRRLTLASLVLTSVTRALSVRQQFAERKRTPVVP